MTNISLERSTRTRAAFLSRPMLLHFLFVLTAGATDVASILLVSVGTGTLYHTIFYHSTGSISDFVHVGLMTALLYLIPCIYRGEYLVKNHPKLGIRSAQVASFWTFAFICLVTLGFLSKTSVHYSRGWLILFYGSGLIALIVVHAIRVITLDAARRLGLIAVQRLFLAGQKSHVHDFIQRYDVARLGCQISGIAYLQAPGGTPSAKPARQLGTSLDSAVARARSINPDNVLLIIPWSNPTMIDQCIDAFMTLPCSISLAPERILDRFEQISIEKLGSVSSLHLMNPPMSFVATIVKRAFDLLLASLALVLLMPLLFATMILIKLDSPGPAVFRQQRYGFNQRSFWIYKFRTMTVLEDGLNLKQATRQDSRLTRVGAFLRRWSIDELPQIINVLLGEMSLVGPRPHALAHDRAWGEKIALYARRHNVKPGITGWAQINGFRGGIVTEDQLRGRIACDLYYIDNWSVWFDIKIILATLVAKAAHRNAY